MMISQKIQRYATLSMVVSAVGLFGVLSGAPHIFAASSFSLKPTGLMQTNEHKPIASSTVQLLRTDTGDIQKNVDTTKLPERIRAFIQAHIPHTESAQEPNRNRTAPIASPTNTTASLQAHTTTTQSRVSSPNIAAVQENLITNPSFEQVGSYGIPVNWEKGGYGDNNRWLYLITGAHTGSYAARVYITKYTSGDAKWYFPSVSVQGGATYDFSDWYFATVPTEVDVQVTHTDGSVTYIVLGKPQATTYGDYTQFNSTFTLPKDASMITIFHVIASAGTLTVDDYSLKLQTQQTSNNYVPNGNLDASGGNGLPSNWTEGGYGDNTRTFTYPITGQSGNAAEVTLSNYKTGDAKWTSDLINLSSGYYQYTDSYKADIPSILTAQFERSDGTFFYSDLATLPSATAWTNASAYFVMPSDATAVRIFHLIEENGTLAIDNVSITDASTTEKGIFKTGAVTFRFDDGDEDQYTNAAPILDAAGFKGTFYIISQQIADNGFSGYMSIAQIKDLYAHGDEIGAHTRTHPHLPTLSKAEQTDEIAGSRQDILSWNVGPVLSFAYPYGEYDATTTQIVENAGFGSGAATISGFNTPNIDHYQLEYQEVNNDTTLAQVEDWVNTASKTHTWLILTFHDIENNGGLYSSTPEMFQNIVNYVKQENIPVVTTAQGMQSM